MQKLSAKDKKFQEERIKFRQTLRELEKEVNFKNKEIDELKIENTELESKIRELQEWIDRLLEFTELSKEQINDMIQTDKNMKKWVRYLMQYLVVQALYIDNSKKG